MTVLALCDHGVEQQMEHVKVTGAVNGRYVISDRRPDGVLTLEPDTSIEAIRERRCDCPPPVSPKLNVVQSDDPIVFAYVAAR